MEVLKLISKSSQETKKIGRILGESLKKEKVFGQQALVIGLKGNLGSGKTTFVQGLAQGLGIKEKVKSPSFVILKIFELKPHRKNKFNHLLHFDCYRLEKPTKKELAVLRFQEFLQNPNNLIVVEWSDKISKFLPKGYLKIEFKILKRNSRELKFYAKS